MKRLSLGCLILVAMLASLEGTPEVRPKSVRSDKPTRLKAGCLYHLARLTTWPNAPVSDPKSPILCGIVGENPEEFIRDFESAMETPTTQERQLVVRRFPASSTKGVELEWIDEIRKCHLLFVMDTNKRRLEDVLERVRGDPILTVGESEDFVAAGGMVAFIVQEGRVAIQVDLEALEEAKLKVSSMFLRHSTILEKQEENSFRIRTRS